MDGLAGTIDETALSSAGIEHSNSAPHDPLNQVTPVFPPPNRADLLMGDPAADSPGTAALALETGISHQCMDGGNLGPSPQ